MSGGWWRRFTACVVAVVVAAAACSSSVTEEVQSPTEPDPATSARTPSTANDTPPTTELATERLKFVEMLEVLPLGWLEQGVYVVDLDLAISRAGLQRPAPGADEDAVRSFLLELDSGEASWVGGYFFSNDIPELLELWSTRFGYDITRATGLATGRWLWGQAVVAFGEVDLDNVRSAHPTLQGTTGVELTDGGGVVTATWTEAFGSLAGQPQWVIATEGWIAHVTGDEGAEALLGVAKDGQPNVLEEVPSSIVAEARESVDSLQLQRPRRLHFGADPVSVLLGPTATPEAYEAAREKGFRLLNDYRLLVMLNPTQTGLAQGGYRLVHESTETARENEPLLEDLLAFLSARDGTEGGWSIAGDATILEVASPEGHTSIVDLLLVTVLSGDESFVGGSAEVSRLSGSSSGWDRLAISEDALAELGSSADRLCRRFLLPPHREVCVPEPDGISEVQVFGEPIIWSNAAGPVLIQRLSFLEPTILVDFDALTVDEVALGALVHFVEPRYDEMSDLVVGTLLTADPGHDLRFVRARRDGTMVDSVDVAVPGFIDHSRSNTGVVWSSAAGAYVFGVTGDEGSGLVRIHGLEDTFFPTAGPVHPLDVAAEGAAVLTVDLDPADGRFTDRMGVFDLSSGETLPLRTPPGVLVVSAGWSDDESAIHALGVEWAAERPRIVALVVDPSGGAPWDVVYSWLSQPPADSTPIRQRAAYADGSIIYEGWDGNLYRLTLPKE